MSTENNNKLDFDTEIVIGLSASMERFVQATYEHLKALDSLKTIANYRINPDYSDILKKAYAGKAAEVKHQARFNAKNIINRTNLRIERTDNLGYVNHEKYDFVRVYKSRKPILSDSGEFVQGIQMKTFFSIKNYMKLLKDKFFSKYRQAQIVVPNDHFEAIVRRFDNEISKLDKQLQSLKNQGNNDVVADLEERLFRIKDLKKRLETAEISTKDAEFALAHPYLSTMYDVLGVSHQAGTTAAVNAAYLGLTIGSIQKAVEILSKDKDFLQATKELSISTLQTSAKSYSNAFMASLIGGLMEKTNKQILKNLAKKNGPAAIVQTASILTKQAYYLARGQITLDDFIQNIGIEGMTLAASFTGSNIGAAIGGTFLPGVGIVIGGVVGSMVYSMLTGALYRQMLQAIEQEKLSAERLEIAQQIANQFKAQQELYREELEQIFKYFFEDKHKQIMAGFDSIEQGLAEGNDISKGVLQLANAFNVELAFESTKDFRRNLRRGDVLEF